MDTDQRGPGRVPTLPMQLHRGTGGSHVWSDGMAFQAEGTAHGKVCSVTKGPGMLREWKWVWWRERSEPEYEVVGMVSEVAWILSRGKAPTPGYKVGDMWADQFYIWGRHLCLTAARRTPEPVHIPQWGVAEQRLVAGRGEYCLRQETLSLKLLSVCVFKCYLQIRKLGFSGLVHMVLYIQNSVSPPIYRIMCLHFFCSIIFTLKFSYLKSCWKMVKHL